MSRLLELIKISAMVLFANLNAKQKKMKTKWHAKNYVSVVVSDESNLEGKIFDVKITGVNKNKCYGFIC